MRNTLLRGFLAAALLAATAAPAAAQDAFWCAPKTVATPNAEGSQMLWSMRLEGGWAAWWCPTATPPGQTGAWYRPYYWAGLYSYGWSKVPAAAERVQTASNPSEQARVEVAALAASAANAVDQCKQRMLRRDACIALNTAGSPGYPAPETAASAAARCGSVQVCTALSPPPVVWRTPLSGTGTLYAVVNGLRASIVPGRTAPPGALCNCASPILYLNASFCPLAAGPANEVTLCRQAAQ